jgi:hypothetical protein
VFTRNRLPNFLASREWKDDCAYLVRWLKDYFESLDRKDALAINETSTWTPTDASGAGLALTITSATYSRGLNFISGQCVITYPATASGLQAKIGGLPVTALQTNVCPIYANGAVAVTAAQIAGTTATPVTGLGAGVTNANLTGANIVLSFHYAI